MVDKDILLDVDGDIMFENGDIKLGASNEQHIELILTSQQGEWRQNPLTGFGIQRHLKGVLKAKIRADFIRELNIQLDRDGRVYKVATYSSEGILKIK